MTKPTSQQLILLSKWLNKFPCNKFFTDEMHCIHEAITAKEMFEIIMERVTPEVLDES